jgi:putative spermidine/putrescine transport system substrate-binding protein
MDRRSFLLSLGAVTLSQGLMGCRRGVPSSLHVDLLARSLPSQLVSKFKSKVESDAELKISLASSAEKLFTTLQEQSISPAEPARKANLLEQAYRLVMGPAPKDIYRLTSLGDYWLQTAIQQKLILPWPQMQGLNALEPQWQKLVKRDRNGNLSATGELWGAPYRWGATMIAYRKDKFKELGWTPTDWSDLWRPELKDKLSLLNQPREAIGLTLKKLNRSYNETNLDKIADLRSELRALDRQTKLYSSTDYLQPLLFGDTWAAVGWSTDILPIIADEANIGVVVPRSGTALWSDIWVCPKTEPAIAKLHQQWIEFWWQPEIAKDLTQFTDAVSPALKELTSKNPEKQLLIPNQAWWNKSEFLEPLSVDTLKQYQALWQQIRA